MVRQDFSPVAPTGMLQAWSGGDASTLESLPPTVYAQLHRRGNRGNRRPHPDLSDVKNLARTENVEIAAVHRISEPTGVRDRRLARAWLYARLQPPNARGGEGKATGNRHSK